jgi:EamA domain-containing membrane protein RarD
MYGEPFKLTHAIAFSAIWLALALYVTAMLRSARAAKEPTPPE